MSVYVRAEGVYVCVCVCERERVHSCECSTCTCDFVSEQFEITLYM